MRRFIGPPSPGRSAWPALFGPCTRTSAESDPCDRSSATPRASPSMGSSSADAWTPRRVSTWPLVRRLLECIHPSRSARFARKRWRRSEGQPQWYAERGLGLDDALLDEVSRVLRLIRSAPSRYPLVEACHAVFAAGASRPSSAIDCSRICTFRILPVTVMGNSVTNFT